MYFGPITQQPSWKWVGADVAEHLRASAEINYFKDIEDIPDGALVFWVKCPHIANAAAKVRQKSLTIIFFPVDSFLNQADILAHQEFIDQASLVCLHAHSLRPYFPNSRIALVEHYNKYGVNNSERQPDNKTLLWIGGFQYVPYVLNGLHLLDWPLEQITLLTNPDHVPAQEAAERNAICVGIPDHAGLLEETGINVVCWSEEGQRRALLTCAAAFDIKYTTCFNQLHKPPTKLQKYISSGIPCAANEDFPGLAQLNHVLTFEQLPSRLNGSSRNVESISYGETLSKQLALDVVAKRYLELAHMALAAPRFQASAVKQPSSEETCS